MIEYSRSYLYRTKKYISERRRERYCGEGCQKGDRWDMGTPTRKRTTKTVSREEPALTGPLKKRVRVQDAASLLRSASKRLEDAMRLIAEATLLQPELDEQLGVEAQRLIGVREAVQGEIKALEVTRLREMD